MKISIIFPKDSEAIFNTGSTRTFGGATVQMYLFAKELNNVELKNKFSKKNLKDVKNFGLSNIAKKYQNLLFV